MGYNCVKYNDHIPFTGVNTSRNQSSTQQLGRIPRECSVCEQSGYTQQNCRSTYVSSNENEETNHSFDE